MQKNKFKNIAKHILRPIPTFLYRPILNNIIRHISQKNPLLFNRLGIHDAKTFIIEPVNFPFIFVLKPKKQNPRLYIRRTKNGIKADATIKGTFLNLLHLVDGKKDGDALFFSRDLSIEGDTEAVVCLRNALDDMDKSTIEQIAEKFGKIGTHSLKILRKMNN